MAKLKRLRSGRVDLEGWTLSTAVELADKVHDAALRGAAEALDWLFSDKNPDPPVVRLAAYWDKKITDPLTVTLRVPFNDTDYNGPKWSFTLDDLVHDLALDSEELDEERVEEIALALENLAGRMRDFKRGEQ